MSAWGWPQWVCAGILLMHLVMHCSKHGQKRDDYNGPATAVEVSVWAFVLYMGGFWG